MHIRNLLPHTTVCPADDFANTAQFIFDQNVTSGEAALTAKRVHNNHSPRCIACCVLQVTLPTPLRSSLTSS
jgi:hypothetical protein